MHNKKFVTMDEEWTVLLVPEASAELMIGEEEHFGVANFNKNIIYLSEEMSYDRMIKVLIHELTHVLASGMGHFTRQTFDHEDLCEFVAHSYQELDRIITQIIGENDEN